MNSCIRHRDRKNPLHSIIRADTHQKTIDETRIHSRLSDALNDPSHIKSAGRYSTIRTTVSKLLTDNMPMLLTSTGKYRIFIKHDRQTADYFCNSRLVKDSYIMARAKYVLDTMGPYIQRINSRFTMLFNPFSYIYLVYDLDHPEDLGSGLQHVRTDIYDLEKTYTEPVTGKYHYIPLRTHWYIPSGTSTLPDEDIGLQGVMEIQYDADKSDINIVFKPRCIEFTCIEPTVVEIIRQHNRT